MTTVAVIAANGRSGKLFVHAALAAGLKVRAGVHGSHNFAAHDGLHILQCDATNQDDVASLIEGADAVVSLIGHGPSSPPRVQSDAFAVLIAAMEHRGIKRVVSLTGTGVRFPGDKPSIVDRLANSVIALIDPDRVHDGIEHAQLLKASTLDWTIVRVLKLGNGSHKGKVTFSLSGPAELITPRERAAAGIVQILTEGSHVRQAPIITGKE